MKKLILFMAVITTFVTTNAFASISHSVDISVVCENYGKDTASVALTMMQNEGIDIDFVILRLRQQHRPDAKQNYLDGVKAAAQVALLKNLSPIETYKETKQTCLSVMSKTALKSELNKG